MDGDIDAAIATQGLSRLHNFYVEGMDLLMQRVGFKGQYIDGLAYDRHITKRIARVMSKNAPDYRIKFHSGNNYDYAGWHCSSDAAIWGTSCPTSPTSGLAKDSTITLHPITGLSRMSGIPFGLTNEMLDYQDGGNQRRGMVYGMDSRRKSRSRPACGSCGTNLASNNRK